MMKLHYAPSSRFVRNVMIAAHETGLLPRITALGTAVAAERPNAGLMRARPRPLRRSPRLIPAPTRPRFCLTYIFAQAAIERSRR